MAATMAPSGDAAGVQGSGPLLSALNPSDIHVLLVDDERLTRLVVGNLLRTCKYKVTIAESGTQALDVLSKAGPGAFQLILTDVMMPDVGGLELLRFVRGHQHLYNVPVIMMSASEAQETMCAALLGSADEYLVKPVTRKEVQNIWMHVMKRYHAATAQPAAAPEEAPAPAVVPYGIGANAKGAYVTAGGGGVGITRGTLLSLSLGLGSGLGLGLPPQVARDMLRAATLAASTTAAVEAARGPLALPPVLPEDPQARTAVAMAPPTGTAVEAAGAPGGTALTEGAGGGAQLGQPTNPYHHRCHDHDSTTAAAADAACHNALAVVASSTVQQPHAQQHQQHQELPHQHQCATSACCPAQAAAGSAAAQAANKVNLLKWLRRPTRCVQPKESFWIFCEVLLLLDSCQATRGSRACGLRPSKLVLYSNGRVAFAPAPAPPAPSAAVAAAAAGSSKCPSGPSCSDGRKRRRPRSGEPSPAAEEEPGRDAGAGGDRSSGGGGGEQMQQPQLQATQGPAAAAAAADEAGSSAPGAPPSHQQQPQEMPPREAQVVVGNDAAALAVVPEDDEDGLYRSPEEEQGQPATPSSDMFSLGLLFFELFYSCTGQERAALLRDARQRVLPASFGRQQPKEAAFALALLHPEPGCRPTLAELLGSAMFRATCASLRQRGQRAASAAAAAAANGQQPPQQQVQQQAAQQQQPSNLPGGPLPPSGHKGAAKQQQVQAQPQTHRLANGSGGAGAVAVGSAVPAAPAVAAVPCSSAGGAPAASTTSSGGAGLRVDDAVLLEFLRMLRKRKLAEMAQMEAELSFLTADGQMVEQYLQYMHQTRTAKRQRGTAAVAAAGVAAAALLPAQQQQPQGAGDEAAEKANMDAEGCDGGAEPPAAVDCVAGATPPEAALAVAAVGGAARLPPALATSQSAAWSEQHQAAQSKWCRISHKYEQLEAVFLDRRRPAPQAAAPQAPDQLDSSADATDPVSRYLAAAALSAAAAHRHADAGGLPEPLLRFAEDLSAFATYTTLTPVASLRYGDPPNATSMVAGAAFDRDDEFFAVAGVSKRIKIFEKEAVLQSNIGAHYPVLEISSRSRLSSVTWSSYIKGHLASADYEGVVQLWDANTNTELLQLEEHRKRVWSIDFSQADPARLLSGGDDGLVKLWSIQQETSTATIDLRANVCSVQFSPHSPHIFAAGCANYRIFLYDMRNTSRALHVLPGHSRAVSYVRFLSASQLVSASTDNTLRLWQLDRAGPEGLPRCSQIFRGHLNERNFTGLSVSPDGYISCGSETNRVFCYYQSMPMPVASYDFTGHEEAHHRAIGGGLSTGGLESMSPVSAVQGGGGAAGGGGTAFAAGAGAGEGTGASPSGHFVSSVCWSRRSNLLLAANSVGYIKLFTLH